MKKRKKLLKLNPKIKLWYKVWKKAFAQSLLNLWYIKENWKIEFPFYFMSSNLVFFFSKYWEFGRFGKVTTLRFFFFWLRFQYLNYWLKRFSLWKKKFFWSYKWKKWRNNNISNFLLRKKALNLKWLNNFIFWWLYIDFSYKWLIWRFSKKLNSIFLLNQKALNFLNRWKFQTVDLIKGFLFVWCTRNNFFVTISDMLGNTLVTRSGGNTGWTDTRQRRTVLTADNTMYECCFLAKERGLQSAHIHVRTSFWTQQIKNCFEALYASGLKIESLVYWPIKSFGGCRKKKWWRV